MARKSSASICKITVFRNARRGKGLASTNPHCNLTSVYDDGHVVQEGCVSWTSIHAALALYENM